MELRFKGRQTVFTADRIEKESEEASTFRPDSLHTRHTGTRHLMDQLDESYENLCRSTGIFPKNKNKAYI